MTKSILSKSLLVGFALFILLSPVASFADADKSDVKYCIEKSYFPVARTVKMIITAYSSTPEETDDTPFETAWGTPVRDGIVATNMLKRGTKIRIPEYFGNKILVVDDTMHQRKKGIIDVWFDNTRSAVNFGAKHNATVEILGS